MISWTDGPGHLGKHVADGQHVADDLDAELFEQPLRHGTHGNAHGRFPGARALQDVPDVGGPVLQGAGQVCMARTGPGDRFGRVQEHGVRRHLVAPVLPVLVADHEADGTAERPAPADTGVDLDRVLLDLHAAAASVSDLPSGQIAVDVRHPDQEARRHPLDDPHEKFAVGLSGVKNRNMSTSLKNSKIPLKIAAIIANLR